MNLYEAMAMNDAEFLIESTENLESLDEGAVKDFIDRQIDKFNGLTKIGLKREDLEDPAKVKAAIKKMEPLKDQNNKVMIKAVISLAISLLGMITSYSVSEKWVVAKSVDRAFNTGAQEIGLDKYGFKSNLSNKYFAQMVAILIGLILNCIYAFVGLTNDFERLMGAFDSSINKIDKAIKKAEKADDKEAVKALNARKKKLIDAKSEVYNKYKAELAKAGNVKEL